MDQKQVNESNASSQEDQNLNDGNESNELVAVDAPNPVAPKVKQTGDIFKLDIDCFEEAFDYIPIEDLVSVGETCKRLQQAAGYCFQENYSGRAVFSSNGIQSNDVDVEHFVPFIRDILTDANGLWYVLDMRFQLRQLKQICIYGMKPVHMNHLKDIPMPKLEILRIEECKLGKNFHEIIEHCTKLKRLEIDYCTSEFDWINRKYPTWEYFKFNPYDQSIEGIPIFLELNPNIRNFTTTGQFFCKNRNKFMSSNINLDVLAIDDFIEDRDEFGSVCNFLNALHERGFYKKLQLKMLHGETIENQKQIDQLATVHGLVNLYFRRIARLSFSALKHLEELHLDESERVADLEILPNSLTNLKRIHFDETDMDAIMPFIRQSVEMQEIKVGFLSDGYHFDEDTGIINLLALNREREQLPDAQKITMYVNEEIYLATKWAMKGNDFGLIRLKRNKPDDSDPDFGHGF